MASSSSSDGGACASPSGARRGPRVDAASARAEELAAAYGSSTHGKAQRGGEKGGGWRRLGAGARVRA
jgi:hypothetical protein